MRTLPEPRLGEGSLELSVETLSERETVSLRLRGVTLPGVGNTFESGHPCGRHPHLIGSYRDLYKRGPRQHG